MSKDLSLSEVLLYYKTITLSYLNKKPEIHRTYIYQFHITQDLLLMHLNTRYPNSDLNYLIKTRNKLMDDYKNSLKKHILTFPSKKTISSCLKILPSSLQSSFSPNLDLSKKEDFDNFLSKIHQTPNIDKIPDIDKIYHLCNKIDNYFKESEKISIQTKIWEELVLLDPFYIRNIYTSYLPSNLNYTEIQIKEVITKYQKYVNKNINSYISKKGLSIPNNFFKNTEKRINKILNNIDDQLSIKISTDLSFYNSSPTILIKYINSLC